MALQAFHHASVKLGQLSDLDDLLGFHHQGKPQLRRGVRGDKVSPRRYEKTTYLQKANARPPQHRKVMGLQQAATGDGPRLLRTPDRQQPNQRRGARHRNSRNSQTKIPKQTRKISTNPKTSTGDFSVARRRARSRRQSAKRRIGPRPSANPANN